MVRIRSVALKALIMVMACGSDSVTLPPPVESVASITLSAERLTLPPGQQLRVDATTRNAQGGVLTGRQVTWSSNAPAVAAIVNGDWIAAVGVGRALVTASSGGKSAVVVVDVIEIAPAILGVRIVTPDRQLLVGATRTFVAEAFDAQGHAVPGTAISWTSLHPSVATITPTGQLLAVQPGEARLQAHAAGRQAEVIVTVEALPLPATPLRFSLAELDGSPVGSTFWHELLSSTEHVETWRVQRLMAGDLVWDVEGGRWSQRLTIRTSTVTIFQGNSIESNMSQTVVEDGGEVALLSPGEIIQFTSESAESPGKIFHAQRTPSALLAMRRTLLGAGEFELKFRQQ